MKIFLFVLLALANITYQRTEAKDAKVGSAVAVTVKVGSEELPDKLILGLFDDATPKTAKNFFELCTNDGLTNDQGTKLTYKGSPFHRIIPNFMVQGGDFTNRNGTGGESIYGRKFNDENFDVAHAKGVLSMANAGPNTNGSQFFITTAETPWLDGRHTVFGRLLRGQTTLNRIEAQGSSSGRPKTEVTFADCRALTDAELEQVLA